MDLRSLFIPDIANLSTARENIDPEREPTTAIFLNQYNFNCILNIYPYKYSSHFSPKKFLVATNRDYYNDLKLIKMQRICDHEVPGWPQLIRYNVHIRPGNITEKGRNILRTSHIVSFRNMIELHPCNLNNVIT